MLNRLSQLRLYSYIDLLVLVHWLGISGRGVVGLSLLWFGFLIFLEWTHRDRGRAHWHPLAWISAWALGLGAVASFAGLAFIAVAILYSYKKRFSALAAISFVLNGLLKAILVWGAATFAATILILTVTAFRNLAGDFRDVRKDRLDGVVSIPVRLGLTEDVRWLYPASLAATTLTWGLLGGVSIPVVLACLVAEMTFYPLTPR